MNRIHMHPEDWQPEMGSALLMGDTRYDIVPTEQGLPRGSVVITKPTWGGLVLVFPLARIWPRKI